MSRGGGQVNTEFWILLFMVTLYAILAGCLGGAILYFMRRIAA